MLRYICILGAMLAIGTDVAMAQNAWFRRFLNPEFALDEPEVSFRTASSLREGTDQRDTQMQISGYDLDFLLPVAASEFDEWFVTARTSYIAVDSSAVLPDTGSLLGGPDALPGEFWDLQFGAGYRRRLDNGWIAGGHLSLGSISNEPFASADEYAIDGNLVLRIPANDQDSWLLLLNYSNTRQFARSVPLPGVAYSWNRGPDFRAMVGVPYSSLFWRPYERVRLQLNYLLPRLVFARAGYELLENVEIYAGYEWSNSRFLRAGRENDDDMLFFFEQRVLGGVRWELSKQAVVDFSAGYAFDRFFFEGEDYDDRGQSRIEMDDGPWFRVQVGLRL